MDTRTKFNAHLMHIGRVHTLHGRWIWSGRHRTNNFSIKRHDDVTLNATSTMAATRVVGVSTGASDSHSQSYSFPPKPFYPSKCFAFPVRKFGSKGENVPSLLIGVHGTCMIGCTMTMLLMLLFVFCV